MEELSKDIMLWDLTDESCRVGLREMYRHRMLHGGQLTSQDEANLKRCDELDKEQADDKR